MVEEIDLSGSMPISYRSNILLSMNEMKYFIKKVDNL